LLLFLFPLNIAGTTPYSLSVSCYPSALPDCCPSSPLKGGKDAWYRDCWCTIYKSNGSVEDITGVEGYINGNHCHWSTGR
jgi:hypothetical protein